MSLKRYHNFSNKLKESNIENPFDVNETLEMLVEFSVIGKLPINIVEELDNNDVSDDDKKELENVVKEFVDNEEDEEEVKEGMKPKKLTGMAKNKKEAKSNLMNLVNKDPELSKMKSKFKTKFIKACKILGKKNGIKVNKIDFSKIKL